MKTLLLTVLLMFSGVAFADHNYDPALENAHRNMQYERDVAREAVHREYHRYTDPRPYPRHRGHHRGYYGNPYAPRHDYYYRNPYRGHHHHRGCGHRGWGNTIGGSLYYYGDGHVGGSIYFRSRD